jgi:hypothetical protein
VNATITLTRYSTSPNAIPAGGQHCWPIAITAKGLGISDSIFVYRAAAVGDPFGGDAFSCVASVNQLFELPETAGVAQTEDKQIPFYRRSTLELFCRSQAEADRIWRIVNEDVVDLVNNYNLTYALQSAETTAVTAAGSTATPITTMRHRIQLDYQPAGVATYVNGLQGITSPDPTLSGWLPAASAPSTWVKPANALFYYNLAKDTVLQEYWPLPAPLDSTEIYRNGLLLPNGVVVAVTNDAIWWLAYDAAQLPEYTRVGSVQDGNAPWPTDYVNRNHVGSVSPQIILMVNE